MPRNDGPPRSAQPALEDVLTYVEARRGLPLAHYRRGMVERRVAYRMQRSGSPTLASYLHRLEGNEAELDALVDTVCIKVSRFFRNHPVFERLAEVLRGLLDAGRHPRVWSAGCGRGEEPYSLAALLEDLGAPPQCRVLATDADPGALAAARQAVFPAGRLDEIPAAYREHFVAAGPDSFRPSAGLRARVEFAPLELASGPPPGVSSFDLILCRNVLIYFTRSLQIRAAETLVSALAPGGLLVLGEAEWFAEPAERGLEPLDRRLRLLARPAAGPVPWGPRGDPAASGRPRGLR